MGAVQSDKVFVYAVNAAGKIIPLPDTRMTLEQCGLSPTLWRRCEAVGAKEIEQVSLVISRQMWEEKKQRTVSQRLREKAFLDQLRVRCRLRSAQSFSKNDVSLNQQIEKKCQRHEDDLINLIVSEFDPTRRHTALEMEISERPIVPHRLGKKREGIAS